MASLSTEHQIYETGCPFTCMYRSLVAEVAITLSLLRL